MTTPRNENLSDKPTLGRYALLREVARSNDIVYEAIDPTINRRIAIKELNIAPTLTGQGRRERIERFFREGRAAGAMNHPNIVTIFEIGEDRGRFFIAMEFLEGQSLRDRLHTVGPLPLAEAVAIIGALCDALAFAHERGVIHRDIKPDNIHILPGGTVKLTDFGIARILGEDQLTMAGQVFGTPSYMSPEQVTGNPLDPRTDQFSLGVLLYEMLTGRKPFTGDTVVTITYRIIHEPVPPPPGVPFEVAQVMERAMGKSPQQRFNSVIDFKNALFFAADRTKSGPYTPTYPSSHPSGMPIRSGNPITGGTIPGYGASPTGGQSTGGQATVMYGPQANAPAFAPQAPNTGGYATAGPPTGNPITGGQAPQRRSNVPIIAGATIVLLVVVGGAGLAFKTAFQNMSNGQKREEIMKVYSDAYSLYNDKDYEKAASEFQQVLDAGTAVDSTTRSKAADGETYCYRQLGQQAQTNGDLPSAEMYFSKALEVSPLDDQAQAELAAVKKLRGTDTVASGSDTVKTPDGQAIDPSKNPLGSLLVPSPEAPTADATPGALASPTATSVLPGSQTASDFAEKNQKAAADAQALLDKGDAAFKAGQRDDAVDAWHQSVAAGPGSPAAIKAQDRLSRFASGDPLGGT